jgi:hypothetical protein
LVSTLGQGVTGWAFIDQAGIMSSYTFAVEINWPRCVQQRALGDQCFGIQIGAPRQCLALPHEGHPPSSSLGIGSGGGRGNPRSSVQSPLVDRLQAVASSNSIPKNWDDGEYFSRAASVIWYQASLTWSSKSQAKSSTPSHENEGLQKRGA